MIQLPSATAVNRIIPKDAFCKRLTLSRELKNKFVSEIKHISVLNVINNKTMNLDDKEKDQEEILLLAIDLKELDIDYQIIENVARQNKHKLVFLLRFENQGQLAIYYSKIYKTVWESLNDLHFGVNGFTLEEVWNSFIEQVALQNEPVTLADTYSIDDRLKRQETIKRLEKEIAKIESLARAEKQPKKRFDLYSYTQELKRKLEVL